METKTRVFALHWLDHTISHVSAPDQGNKLDALTLAINKNYSRGALRALDYWEEITDKPDKYEYVLVVEDE